MESDINTFLETLDFKNYDYFFHQTACGNGEHIIEEGLYVKGINILNTNNVLYTTTCPLLETDVASFEDFIDFLNDIYSSNIFRTIGELVIIGVPKHLKTYIVTKETNYLNGEKFEGIISNHVILGYIDILEQTFISNENYDYLYDIENEKRLLK